MVKKMFLGMMIGTVVLSSCGSKEEGNKQPDAVSVKTEDVHATSDYSAETYVGTVEAESSTAVSFTSSGTIMKVTVSEGQPVHKGQLIAVLDATTSKNTLSTAEAQLTQAKDAIARYKQLHDNGSLPEIQWVEAQSKLQQAQASYDIAKKMLKDCNLYAPVSGVVGTKYLNTGETALPAQPVISILDISNVKVNVSMPEKEIGSIYASTSSTIDVAALGNATFRGGRIEKGVEADALTRTYQAKINVANPGGKLLPGMVCNVRFGKSTDSNAPAITVPITAVQKGADGNMSVWKAVGGKAVRTKVSLGETYGDRIVICSGLTDGDKVVVEGCQNLSDGSTIKF